MDLKNPFIKTTPLTPASSKADKSADSDANPLTSLAQKNDRERAVSLDVKTPSMENPAQSNAEQSARLWMTALKLFTPIVDAVISQPVSEYEAEKITVSMFQLLKSTNNITAQIAHYIENEGEYDLQKKEHRWVLRQIIPFVAQSVAEQWKNHGVVNEGDINRLFEMTLSSIKKGELSLNANTLKLDEHFIEACMIDDRFIRVPAAEAITVAQMNALSNIVSEVSQFSCWQPSDQIMSGLTQIVSENAEFLYFQQSEHLMSERGRLVLLQASLHHSGNQVLGSFRSHAKALLDTIDSLPAEHRSAFIEQRKAPEALSALLKAIADDTKQRTSLLHNAADAGKKALDVLLKRTASSLSPQQTTTEDFL